MDRSRPCDRNAFVCPDGRPDVDKLWKTQFLTPGNRQKRPNPALTPNMDAPVLGGAKPLVDRPAEKPVLQEPEPGLASVRRRFGTPQSIFVLKHGQVSLNHDPFDEPRDAVQIHHGVKARGLLPPRVVTVGTTTVLRGTGARAADAHRMPPGRRGGHAILDPQLVLPPAPHVVDVTKLRVPAKPEIRKGNVHWLAVQTWPGVDDAPDAELKEMDRFPSHRHLKHAVKFVQRHGVRHKNAPPDHGADPKQPDLQLQKNRSRVRRCPGIRHATRLQEALHNASSRLTPEILVVPCRMRPGAKGVPVLRRRMIELSFFCAPKDFPVRLSIRQGIRAKVTECD